MKEKGKKKMSDVTLKDTVESGFELSIMLLEENLKDCYKEIYNAASIMKYFDTKKDFFIKEWEDNDISFNSKKLDRNLFYDLEHATEKLKKVREEIEYLNQSLSTLRYLQREYLMTRIEKNIDELGKISVEY